MTQFFAAPPARLRSRPEDYLEISPVALATVALSTGAILLLLGTVWSFLRSLVFFLTDSIIFTYTFALFGSLFLVACILVVTRRSYHEKKQRAPEHDDEEMSKRIPKESKWLVVSLAVVAILSLALLWTAESVQDGGYFRGFEFLLSQRSSDDTFALSPPVFRDMRILVSVAVTFVLVCLLDALARSHRAKPLSVYINETRQLLAVCILGLSIYFLAYIGTLQYECVYSTPWLDRIAPEGSLIRYNPAHGFWIFLVCCLLLVFLSFRAVTKRVDRLLGSSSRWAISGLRIVTRRRSDIAGRV